MKAGKQLQHFWASIVRQICAYQPTSAIAGDPVAMPDDAPWAFYEQASYVGLLDWAAASGAVAIPDQLRAGAQTQITVEMLRQKARRIALSDLLGWAHSVDIAVMPLKGGDTAFRLWPQAHLRVMGDIDLLVPQHNVDAVSIHLQKLGFEPRSRLPDAFYKLHHHTMPLYRAADGVLIELHTRALPASVPEALARGFSAERTWDGAQHGTLLGQPCYLMNATANWFFTLLHATNDLKLFGGLFPIIDLALLLNSADRCPDDGEALAIFESFPRILMLASQYNRLMTALGGREFAATLTPHRWPLDQAAVPLRHKMAMRDYLQHAVYGVGTDINMKNNHLVINRIKSLGASRLSGIKLTDIAASYLRRG